MLHLSLHYIDGIFIKFIPFPFLLARRTSAVLAAVTAKVLSNVS